jgi:RIO kinase 1
VAESDEPRKMQERLLRLERDNRYLRKDSDQRKMMEEVFDRATLVALEELVTRKDLKDLNGAIASGKEARVFYGLDLAGRPLAVKIYLTSASDFRKRTGYIAGDRRFGNLPSGSRAVIYLWTRKEYKNLQLADSGGIRVPRPVAFHKNIIIMEYIGSPPRPAPTFAETEVDESDYDWTFETMLQLRKKAKLVHADFSEFNVFKTPTERVLFDMGSAVLSSHPQAEEFLRRDASNMVRFFRKRGIFKEDADYWMEKIWE